MLRHWTLRVAIGILICLIYALALGSGSILNAAQTTDDLKAQLKATQDQLQKERSTKETLQWSIVNGSNSAAVAAAKAQEAALAKKIAAMNAAHADISKRLTDTKSSVDAAVVSRAEIHAESGQAKEAAETAVQTTSRAQWLINGVQKQQQLGIAFFGRIHKNVVKIELSINSRMDALLKATELAALGRGASDERTRRQAEVADAIRDRISPRMEHRVDGLPPSRSTVMKEAALADATAKRMPFLPEDKKKPKAKPEGKSE